MILVMFCLEERNIGNVLARLRVISFPMHQLKKLERSAIIKFERLDSEELETGIIASSAYRYSSHNSM